MLEFSPRYSFQMVNLNNVKIGTSLLPESIACWLILIIDIKPDFLLFYLFTWELSYTLQPSKFSVLHLRWGSQFQLEKAMAPHSSTLAWKIPWTEEPGGLHAVHGVAKSQTRLSDFTLPSHFHASEKEMATHSSTLAWKIPLTEEHGRLQSMRLQRVDTKLSDFTLLSFYF